MAGSQDFPKLVLKSGKQRSLVRKHPWVFSGAVKERPTAEDGGVVKVVGNKGDFLGYGHYAPASSIIVRVFEWQEDAAIDGEYWKQKLRDAHTYRLSLGTLSDCTGIRAVFAEGDGMPGVVIDRFGELSVLQLRTDGARKLESLLVEVLRSEYNIKYIYVEHAAGEGNWVGEEGGASQFVEHGLKFTANPSDGQKTGFFLDQRDNRMLVRAYAKGKNVLDVFCYSGGFTVNALAGGASHVVSVDASEAAISLCKKHVDLNGFGADRHEGRTKDAFEHLREIPDDHFDLIVLDPPAFTKHISTVDRASRGYKDINLSALRKIKQGGFLFTFSCSQHISKDLFRKIVFGAAADSGRDVRIVQHLNQAADHPINIYFPEGEYLKGLLLYVD